MLSMDKEAIKELTEMEAVPICNILGSLLGRSVKMSVSKVEETDMGSLAEGLPHFNVAIAYQLYHGCAGGCPEPPG